MYLKRAEATLPPSRTSLWLPFHTPAAEATSQAVRPISAHQFLPGVRGCQWKTQCADKKSNVGSTGSKTCQSTHTGSEARRLRRLRPTGDVAGTPPVSPGAAVRDHHRGESRERIGMLKERSEDLEAEERQLAQETPYEPSEAIGADEAAQWAELLPDLLAPSSGQQRKALMRRLIKEIRVISRGEIVPTYRIPPLVRAVSGSVDPIGIEPTTSAMPWRFSPIRQPAKMPETVR
jgi:hypothetical protein